MPGIRPAVQSTYYVFLAPLLWAGGMTLSSRGDLQLFHGLGEPSRLLDTVRRSGRSPSAYGNAAETESDCGSHNIP